MKLRSNRRPERAAVNAVRTFFEGEGCVFQEVDLGNDYGKDAYVDLTDNDTVTGFCIALQIKGGRSFRRPGGYGIPIDPPHVTVWRHSTIPLAGVVHDPEDGLLRWCNISTFLQDNKSPPSYIPIPKGQILSTASLRTAFNVSMRKHWDQHSAGRAVLQLCSGDEDIQCSALADSFAFGRSDARVFIAVRHMLSALGRNALPFAIHLLSHVTAHPDIFWSKDNWVPDNICKEVVKHFQWSSDEIISMMDAIPWEEWQRGQLGESLYMLLHEDKHIKSKMRDVAVRTARAGKHETAFAAFYLSLYWCEANAKELFCELIEEEPRLADHDLLPEVRCLLNEHGGLCLFE